MNKELLDGLKKRRSVRSYKPEQIKDEELQAVLEAGTYAPTGQGSQCPVIVVAQDPELVKKLSAMNAAVMGREGTDPFYGAPTVLIVLADKNRSTYVEDGSLVLGNLMNAAYAVGLGSCWIHRAKQMFESEEGKAMLKEWGLSEDYVGIGNCILGYNAEDTLPAPRPRKENYVIKA